MAIEFEPNQDAANRGIVHMSTSTEVVLGAYSSGHCVSLRCSEGQYPPGPALSRLGEYVAGARFEDYRFAAFACLGRPKRPWSGRTPDDA